MAYVFKLEEKKVLSTGGVKLIDTKGSSTLLVIGDRSFFIPKKHIRQDFNNNDDYTVFLNETWEYSEPKSHYDESAKQYVKDPVVYVKGGEIMRLLRDIGCTYRKLEPKAVKEDSLPF